MTSTRAVLFWGTGMRYSCCCAVVGYDNDARACCGLCAAVLCAAGTLLYPPGILPCAVVWVLEYQKWTKKCTAEISLGDHDASTSSHLHHLSRRIGAGGLEHLSTPIGCRECCTLPSSRHACCSNCARKAQTGGQTEFTAMFEALCQSGVGDAKPEQTESGATQQ